MLFMLLVVALPTVAQRDAFEQFRQQQNAQFNRFRDDKQEQYDLFRQQTNARYAEFMRQAWAEFPVNAPDIPAPEELVPPVIYDEPDEPLDTEEVVPSEQPEHSTNAAGTASQPAKYVFREIRIDPSVVVVPTPTPSPEPIAPVKAKPTVSETVQVTYYGRPVAIEFPKPESLTIGLSEDALADAWTVLSGKAYDITVKSALDLRQQYDLCDWAYMDALRAITEKHYGATNEAVLMQAFLMTQSGYRVRLAKAGEKLYMLVASKYQIYNMRYLKSDGTKFYVTGDYHGEKLHMCPAAWDKEQSLSMQLAELPALGDNPTQKRKLTSKKGVTASVSVNKYLIDFFRQYPQANIDGDFTTRWAAYANTPLDQNIQDELYPVLQQTVSRMNEYDAVNILLNWVQTAFKYGYDDQIWGGDRAFFAQETLYYPQSDCEDRSILFTRLVRDILGLDVALLYYPGHLAAAVSFKTQQQGDWFTANGRRFIVCDPTYINAPVGMTMPGMEDKTPKVIILK